MDCPKCHSPCDEVATADGVVDRCTHCQGLWFDNMEHEDIKPHASFVDVGDAAKGAEFNAIDRIDCPRCPNSRLIRMVDPVQPHIWFESCPTCYGRFYDAGEFRDFAELKLSEILRRKSGKART
ncbi:MAG TPA: zf-TFIIB domain-containing protein [Arenimonas sp.]|nr:zf-TFIIB domain-containing protein [Arenimonas sp.]